MGAERLQSEFFEWGPGGLSLLDAIYQIIEDNGGRAAMYDIVNDEVNEDKFKINRQRMEDGFRNTIKYNIKLRDASDLMGVNYHQFVREFRKFKETQP